MTSQLDHGPQGLGIENWRDVPGFAGLYEVSSAGRVRSLPRQIRSPRGMRAHPGRVMSPVIDKDGYPRIVLRVDGKHYTRKVHRLVCEAFHGPPTALHRHVDHIDGDRANACSSNLRWVSHGENMHFRHRDTGAPGERNGNAILTDAAVREIRASDKRAKALALQFNVTPYAIYDVRNGRRWAHVLS